MRASGLNPMAHALQLVEGVWTIPIIALGKLIYANNYKHLSRL